MTSQFVPGADGRPALRVERHPRVMRAAPEEPGRHGRGGAPTTSQRAMVAASLLLPDSRADRHNIYPTRRAA